MNRLRSLFAILIAAAITLSAQAHNALSIAELCDLAQAHGEGMPANLIVAQIEEESGGQPTIVSSAGAVGLMQIVAKFHPGVNLDDPVTNIVTGVHIMQSDYRYLNHMRANLAPDAPIDWANEEWTKRALAGYVMGPGNVSWYDKHPDRQWPANVQGYANNIWALYQRGYCGHAA